MIYKSGENFLSVNVKDNQDKTYQKLTLEFVNNLNFLTCSIEKLVEIFKKTCHEFDN